MISNPLVYTQPQEQRCWTDRWCYFNLIFYFILKPRFSFGQHFGFALMLKGSLSKITFLQLTAVCIRSLDSSHAGKQNPTNLIDQETNVLWSLPELRVKRQQTKIITLVRGKSVLWPWIFSCHGVLLQRADPRFCSLKKSHWTLGHRDGPLFTFHRLKRWHGLSK